MLVLNRRPGESIIIEPGIEVCVVSVAERKVWLSIVAPGVKPEVRVSASVLSDDEARLEIGAPVSLTFGGDGVVVEVGDTAHPSLRYQTTIGLNRRVGESVAVGDHLRVGVGSVLKGNPCLTVEGPSIGSGIRITVIRPMGSYVRIGVDAPGRRVYRKELIDEMTAAARATPAAPPG